MTATGFGLGYLAFQKLSESKRKFKNYRQFNNPLLWPVPCFGHCFKLNDLIKK
jgi:hypothetical protein